MALVYISLCQQALYNHVLQVVKLGCIQRDEKIDTELKKKYA